MLEKEEEKMFEEQIILFKCIPLFLPPPQSEKGFVPFSFLSFFKKI